MEKPMMEEQKKNGKYFIGIIDIIDIIGIINI